MRREHFKSWMLMAVYCISVVALLSYFTASPRPPKVAKIAEEAEATLGESDAQEVYGGTIRGIDVIASSTTKSRVFTTTESANSMFYADVDHSGTTPAFGKFQVVPDLNDEGGFGTITLFDVDKNSGWIYFSGQSGSAHPQGLHRCSTTAESLTSVQSGNVAAMTITEGYLFFVLNQTNLYFGTIDATTGAFTAGAGAPVTIAAMNSATIIRNSVDNYLYILDAASAQAASTKLYKSSALYNAFSSSTTFSQLTMPAGTWSILGCGPDGRLFLGGLQSGNASVCYSDDYGSTWSTPISVGGGSLGPNIDCVGTSSSYNIFWGTKMSTDMGSSWKSVPTKQDGSLTHANDGPVRGDPNNSKVLYIQTDGGIGASADGAATIFEINDGIEAVQVKDFVVDSSGSSGWAVAKTGVYHVTDLQTDPEWSDPMRPLGEGATFYSVGMDTSDATGATSYAASSRVYKTTDAGAKGYQSSWTKVRGSLKERDGGSNEDPLTPYKDAPFYWVSSVVLDPDNADYVFVGYNVQDTSAGELYFSQNAGQTWLQVPVVTPRPSPDTPYTGDVDVNDILITEESGARVIYVAVSYNSSNTSAGSGIYRITGSSTTGWVVTHDLTDNVSITSLAIDSDGNLYACGVSQSGSQYQPVVYGKESGGSWSALTTTGLNMTGGTQSGAIAVGPGIEDSTIEVPYVAYGRFVYLLPVGASGWMMGYEYAEGTMIYVITGSMIGTATSSSLAEPASTSQAIYVGTGTGLYAHVLGAASEEEEEEGLQDSFKVSIPEGTSSFQVSDIDYDFSQDYPDLGIVEVGIDVDLKDVPAGANLELAILKDISNLAVGSSSLQSLFELAAAEDDLSLEEIAYVVSVDKTNITSDNMGQAIITMKVGKAWGDTYGTGSIRILRIADDGTREVLPTEFKGYSDDGTQAIFEGTSAKGLSYFGLAAVEESDDSAIPLSAVVGGIAAAVVILGAGITVAILLLRRRHHSPAAA